MILIRAVWCNPGELSQRRHSVRSISVFWAVGRAGGYWLGLALAGISTNVTCHFLLLFIFHSVKFNATGYMAAQTAASCRWAACAL